MAAYYLQFFASNENKITTNSLRIWAACISYILNQYDQFQCLQDDTYGFFFLFVLQLPLDLNELSDKDKQIRLALRKPRQQVKVQEDIEHDFDAKKYLQFVKKVKK